MRAVLFQFVMLGIMRAILSQFVRLGIVRAFLFQFVMLGIMRGILFQFVMLGIVRAILFQFVKLGIIRGILFQFVMLDMMPIMTGSMAIAVSLAPLDISSLLQMKIIVFHAQEEQQQLVKLQHQGMLVVSQEIIHVQINTILNEDRMTIIHAFLPLYFIFNYH